MKNNLLITQFVNPGSPVVADNFGSLSNSMNTREGLTISLRRGQIAQEQVILLCHFTRNNITGSFRVSLIEMVMGFEFDQYLSKDSSCVQLPSFFPG